MWLSDTRIDKTTRRGLTALVFNGVFGFSWDTLTSGAFLAGFAVAAGAGNFTIGVLAAIPLLAQVLQIPAVLWLERWRRPKRMLLAIGPFSRGLWLLLALVPLLFTGGSAVNALIVVLFVASCSGAFLGVAWNTLVRLFVPEHIMGRYFSYRLRVSVGATVVVGLLAGFFVDWWRGRHPDAPLSAYSFVFGAGALCALLSLLFLFRVPEQSLPPARERASSAKVLKEPLQDRNFRSLLVFMFLWGFGINLALPFFAVYLLRRLGFPLSTVVVFTTVSQLSFILFVNAWGRLADLVGNRAVLYTCGLLLVLMVLAFPFSGLLVSHHALLITFLVVIHIFSGMAIGGVTLASSNIALKLSPTGSAHTYLAVNGMVGSAAGAMAPLIAGFLGDFFAGRSFAVRISWTSPRGEWATNILNFQGLDFVFLLAVLLSGFALHRLAFVKEEGAATERLGIEQVAHELTREVKDVTSIGGLRNLVSFPITLTSLARRTLWDSADEAQEAPRR